MADISVRRQHGMSLDEAKSKVKTVVEDIQKEFSSLVSEISWNGEETSAKVKGRGFSGQFQVDNSDVAIDIDLSLFAKPLRGKVQERIEERMNTYFG